MPFLSLLLFSLLLPQECPCSVLNHSVLNEFGKNDTLSMLKVYNLLQNAGENICKTKWGKLWDMKKKQGSVYLSTGYLMTFKEDEGIFLSGYPYYQLEGHNMSDPGYIKLPDNISELNDYMCGPMNRKGFLCGDCIDGFGPSASSIGYKCSNCTDKWYGVPLYLLLELLPVTIFYFIILIFPIPITYAPLPCFILYSQLIMYEITIDQQPPINKLVITQLENNSLLKFLIALYSIWSLQILNYIVPPFCISESIRLIHIAFLGCISIAYQIILITVTWICIELHGNNCKLMVWLWKPFNDCFGKLRRRWDSKSDMIDVFSAFFLISYSRLIFQLGMFLECSCITRLSEDGNITYKHSLVYDPSADCVGVDDSTKSFSVAILATVSVMLFYASLVLLLVLYPIKKFRICMSKCKLDRLSVTAFVEKFHGCYKDGLDGGRDMRSFSGLYILRFESSTIHVHWFWSVQVELTSHSLVIHSLSFPYFNSAHGLLQTLQAYLYECIRYITTH